MFFFGQKGNGTAQQGRGGKSAPPKGRQGNSTTPQGDEGMEHHQKGEVNFSLPSFFGGGASLRLLWVVLPSSAIFGWRGLFPFQNEMTGHQNEFPPSHRTTMVRSSSLPRSPWVVVALLHLLFFQWWFGSALAPLWRRFTLHPLQLGVRPFLPFSRGFASSSGQQKKKKTTKMRKIKT